MSSYTCKQCDLPTIHYEFHDSFCCVICNSWNEEKCSDENCYYCNNRPDKPFDADIHEIILEGYEELGIEPILIVVDDVLEEEYNE